MSIPRHAFLDAQVIGQAIQDVGANGFSVAHGGSNLIILRTTVDGTFTSDATTAIADGLVDGQRLLLMFATSVNSLTATITIKNSANTQLEGDFTAFSSNDGAGAPSSSFLSLRWDDTSSTWIEIARRTDRGTSATGNASRAVGDRTTASSGLSEASGISTTASGFWSHAEGHTTTASGYASHAEGRLTTASGHYSHAEGKDTVASDQYAHAEGQQTTASADYAHSEGYLTEASANGAHAEGISTVASGLGAHAQGQESAATRRGQHAQASDSFSDPGDAQTSVLTVSATTTNNTPTEMFIRSSERLGIPVSTTWAFRILLAAKRVSGDNESLGYECFGVIDNNTGTVALVGSLHETTEQDGSWAVAVTADNTNDSLCITVTGENSKTIRWHARVELSEVTATP